MRFLTILSLLLVSCYEEPVSPPAATESLETAAEALAMLTLPSKLDALKGDRAANQRLREACYWLRRVGDQGDWPNIRRRAKCLFRATLYRGNGALQRSLSAVGNFGNLFKMSVLWNRAMIDRQTKRCRVSDRICIRSRGPYETHPKTS